MEINSPYKFVQNPIQLGNKGTIDPLLQKGHLSKIMNH